MEIFTSGLRSPPDRRVGARLFGRWRGLSAVPVWPIGWAPVLYIYTSPSLGRMSASAAGRVLVVESGHGCHRQGRQMSSGSGNRRVPQSATVSASVDCRRRKAGAWPAELRARTSAAVPSQGTDSSPGGDVEERLGHRELAYRMTGRLLDDLPQAVPCSGMGALIAAQGGRGLGGGHEPALCRYRLQPADADKACGISRPIPVPLGALIESAGDDKAVRAGPCGSTTSGHMYRALPGRCPGSPGISYQCRYAGAAYRARARSGYQLHVHRRSGGRNA